MPGGGVLTLHVPRVEPTGTVQWLPVQQSASTVHAPVVGMQATPPSGAFAAHTSVLFGPGTHGLPLQQSPVYAHVSVGFLHAVIVWQRGTPTGSSWHAPELPGAPQQSSRDDEMLHA